MTETSTRSGVYSEFTVTMDDSALIKALGKLERRGEQSLDGFMAIAANKMIEEVKKELKSKAGALANVRVPSPKGLPFKQSTQIHVKVANALKVHKLKKLEYTIHTGKNIQEAAVGVLGQRGGRIGHIVAKGMDPFRYGNLPMLVMSSTRWYKKTGQAGWPSTGMRMRASHPGFYQTLDYIGSVEDKMKDYFNKYSDDVIFSAAIASGFSTAASNKMAIKSIVNARTGGAGVMAGRSP